MTARAPNGDSPEPTISLTPAMQAIYQSITRLMGNDLTVTISGEPGCGKSLMARMLHQMSGRKDRPFVAVNAAGHAGDLFGPQGKCAQAGEGTLLIEEVEALPAEAQQALLARLKAGDAAFRLICTTACDLMRRVSAGAFSEDLYYRLNVIPLRLPPLRDRQDDIAPLAEFFLRRAAAGGPPPRILDEQTLAAMRDYRWPGNVRELENMMLRFCTLHGEPIVGPEAFLAEILPPTPAAGGEGSFAQAVEAHLRGYFAAHTAEGLPPAGLYARILPLIEKPLIEITLAATGGNQLRAAHVLGINRNTLRKKMDQLRIHAGGSA